jgi:hypothetical protein
MATDASYGFLLPGFPYSGLVHPGTTFPLMSTEALEPLGDWLGNVSTPDFTRAFQNVFQAIYHLVRVDLGVILDNQIYNSPQMFNLSIMPMNLPSFSANKYRAATSNSTLMAQWRQRVAFYQTSDRVTVMDYLRPVPRLKPLGSAITSVFVSTFAMLSALWTIFSLGAGALARRTGQSPAKYIYFIASPKIFEAPARQRLSAHADSKETISGESGRFVFKRFGVHLHAKTLDGTWAPRPALLFRRSPHQYTFGSSI